MPGCIQNNQTPISYQKSDSLTNVEWRIKVRQIQEKTKIEIENLLKFVEAENLKIKIEMEKNAKP
jgi:hypothetical protein